MADDLEKKVEAAAPKGGGKSIFDTVGGSIDSLLKTIQELPSDIKKGVHCAYYGVKAGLGLAAGFLMGGYHALILPAGIAAGCVLANWKNKAKTTFKQIANELAVGGILGGLLHYIFSYNSKLGKIAQASYGTAASLLTRGGCAIAQLPVFLGVHEYLNRALISDYKPQPLSDMGKKLKTMWPIIPPILANFTVVPDYLGHRYQMPLAAAISTLYGLIKGEKKKEEKKEAPAPYGLPPGYAMPQPA